MSSFKRALWLGLAVLASLLVLAACGGDDNGDSGNGTEAAGSDTEATADGTPIKIGSHLPLTGPASFVGQGFQSGVDMAVKEINEAGGVNGSPLEVTYVDTEASPTEGVTAVRQLVERDNVDVILAGGTTGETVPALPVIEQSGVPYISLAGDPDVYDPIKPNIFLGTTVPEPIKANNAADWIAENLKPKTVALTVCDAGHCIEGGPILTERLESHGIEVIVTNDHGIADTDFTAQVQELVASDPDLIYVYSLAASGARIVNQLRIRGYEGDIAGDSGQATPDVIELAGEGAEGFYSSWFASTQVPSDETGAMGEFMAAFAEEYPNPPAGLPNIYTLMGYQDAYVVAEALRVAGSAEPDAVIDALNNMNDFVAGEDDNWTEAFAIGTPRSFSEDDHVGSEFVEMVVVRDGNFVLADEE